MGMKENIVYNQYDNAVYVKTDGDKISIICNEEDQIQKVIKNMNILSGIKEIPPQNPQNTCENKAPELCGSVVV